MTICLANRENEEQNNLEALREVGWKLLTLAEIMDALTAEHFGCAEEVGRFEKEMEEVRNADYGNRQLDR